MSFIKSQIYMKLWPPGKLASRNNINRNRRVRIRPSVPPFQRKTATRRSPAHWIEIVCACAPSLPYGGVPTRLHRLSPLKNQRDEEQRQPGTMRSRLPRTACLLRLIALCILLAHSAAYFGSAYCYYYHFLVFLLYQLHKIINYHCYLHYYYFF